MVVVSDGASTMGSYVDWLNVVRERVGEGGGGGNWWGRDAVHRLMHAISKAKGSVKVWCDASDDVVSLLTRFYRTSLKRLRWLWGKGGEFCFSWRTSVQWAEAMFHSLDIVLENLPVVLLSLPRYINSKVDLGHREKAKGLWAALQHPIFKSTAALFWEVVALVHAPSKKVQTRRGAQVDAIRGLMKVMCTQLWHTRHHVIPRGFGGGGGGRLVLRWRGAPSRAAG